MAQSNLTVGYKRIPSRTSEGSKADYNKSATLDARASMSGIVKQFSALVASWKLATPDALEMALMPTFDKAQLYCPVDTGMLVESGELISGVNSDGSGYAQISFGGGGVIHYAAIVHERTDLRHESPTRSKYLQAAVEEDLGKMQGRFVRALKKIAKMEAM